MKPMATRLPRLLLAALLLPPLLLVVRAEPGHDAAATARDTARHLQSEVQQAVGMDPATLVPGYSTDVPQSELYQNAEQLTPAANSVIDGNQAATAVSTASGQRERIVLDKDNDPMLIRAKAIADDNENIVGMGQVSDSGCISIAADNSTSSSVQRCTSWNASSQSCSHNCYCPNLAPVMHGLEGGGNITTEYSMPELLLFSGTNQDNWHSAWSGAGDGYSQCSQHDAEFSFMVEDVDAVASFSLQDAAWRGHIRLELNGRQVFIGPHSGDSLQAAVNYRDEQRTYRSIHCTIVLGPSSNCISGISGNNQCCRYSYSTITVKVADYFADYGIQKKPCAAGPQQRQPDLDLRPWLRQGQNKLKIRVVAAAATGVRLRFAAQTRCSCNEAGSLSDGGCAQLQRHSNEGQCQLQQYKCLDGEKLCSQQSRNYICLGSQLHEEPYCAELRQRGCFWEASECVDVGADNNCVEYEQQYRCRATPLPQPQIEDCGARISCIDGDCTETGYSPSGDFATAATHLSALQEAAADFDADNLSIFSGSSHRCKKTILGFANCCRDSGWGVSLGLSRCSDSERILGEKRQAGQCHYVGSYKRGSLFNKKRYQGYCCFSSKLGRVIQQQARAQLGLDWGPAPAPQCRGISTDELGTLDFERFDLGEVEADMVQQAMQAERPGTDSLIQRLRQALQQ